MKKVRYHEMLPHEIMERRKHCPAAFIGLGGLEWHGEHLAVGNDALKAEKLCDLAAEASGGFSFPPLWYGEPRVGNLAETDFGDADVIRRRMKLKKKKFSPKHFGKSLEEQQAFYRQLIYHTLIQMNQLEMKAVCLVAGHYPLHFMAEPVVDEFNKTFSDTQAYVGIEAHYSPPSKHVGGDHAGKWETSYLWYLRPDCVDMSIFLGREDETLIGAGPIDPRTDASVEIGRKACDMMVAGLVEKANTLITAATKKG